MESVGNSTIQVLDASTTVAGIYPSIFNGTPQDTEGYESVHITCVADQPGTIVAWHSIDNSVWDISESIVYPDTTVGTALFETKLLKARWFKTEFVNPGSVSCNLRLHTMLHTGRPLDVGHDSVSVSVGGTVLVSEAPISNVWESSDLSTVTTVESSSLTMYTLHCLNFASGYRFVKLYDISTTINPAVDTPTFTIPAVTDIPRDLEFATGLLFNNAMQVRVTRFLSSTDTSMTSDGDVHLTITYKN